MGFTISVEAHPEWVSHKTCIFSFGEEVYFRRTRVDDFSGHGQIIGFADDQDDHQIYAIWDLETQNVHIRWVNSIALIEKE